MFCYRGSFGVAITPAPQTGVGLLLHGGASAPRPGSGAARRSGGKTAVRGPPRRLRLRHRGVTNGECCPCRQRMTSPPPADARTDRVTDISARPRPTTGRQSRGEERGGKQDLLGERRSMERLGNVGERNIQCCHFDCFSSPSALAACDGSGSPCR